MKINERNLLLEAYRRWIVIGSDLNESKRLGEKWLGLGAAREYRSVLNEGYMQWVHDKPISGTMGWLKLTVKGEEAMRQFAKRGIGENDFQDFDFVAHDKLKGL